MGDPRPIALALMAGSFAHAQDVEDRPIVTECHDLSEEIEGCLCLDEDKVLDAVSELKACRKNKAVLPDSKNMTWVERVSWFVGLIIGIWIL